MANNKFHLDIYTPTGKYLSEEVVYLEVRNSDSVLGILPFHTPLITTIILCPLRIRFGGRTRVYATTGGIMNIKSGNTVSLMLSTIERSDEIDIERAKRSKDRAERYLNDDSYDQQRAKASLDRANNRIAVAKEDDKK